VRTLQERALEPFSNAAEIAEGRRNAVIVTIRTVFVSASAGALAFGVLQEHARVRASFADPTAAESPTR
jgi:hypothetical protein